FLFRKNPLFILYLIFYILTYIIRNNIILINNYISPKSFFIINLENQNIKRNTGFKDRLISYYFY
ncbi:hypothetical protein NA56DRAFT_562418, partial [Hyaloscypha hepaticicola]